MDKFDEAADEVKTETERAQKLLGKAADLSKAGQSRDALRALRQARIAQDHADAAYLRTATNDEKSAERMNVLAQEISDAAYAIANLDYS